MRVFDRWIIYFCDLKLAPKRLISGFWSLKPFSKYFYENSSRMSVKLKLTPFAIVWAVSPQKNKLYWTILPAKKIKAGGRSWTSSIKRLDKARSLFFLWPI